MKILDVGAMIEAKDTPRYMPLVDQGIATVTGFEPNPAEFEKLTANFGDRYQWLPYVLGNGEKSEFRMTKFPGGNSLLEPDPNTIDRFWSMNATLEDGDFRIVSRSMVETKKLNDVAECPAPDFMKIDVQGAELEIFENGMENLSETLIIESDVEFLPLY